MYYHELLKEQHLLNHYLALVIIGLLLKVDQIPHLLTNPANIYSLLLASLPMLLALQNFHLILFGVYDS